MLATIRSVLRAAATTVVPEASQLGESEWAALEGIVLEALTRRPPALQRQFLLFLRLVEWLPVLRYGRRFTALDPEQQRRFLEALQDAPLLLGPRIRDHEFSGRELDMARALYVDGAGFLSADGTMTLAFARCYGGSTVVYTGTSLTPSERVIRRWNVPGLDHADLVARARRYLGENNVHLLPSEELNDNNRLFAAGAAKAGYAVEQFPVNVKGCHGSSLCNLGCPNQAKQGTNRVQLPAAERGGVEILTGAEVLRIEADRALVVRVAEPRDTPIGLPSEWAPGEYRDRRPDRRAALETRQAVDLVGASDGGCAMGATPRDSVTDTWGRVHGLPWLRVADASLFPGALEINPYVTIMALADRVAEGVRADAPALLD